LGKDPGWSLGRWPEAITHTCAHKDVRAQDAHTHTAGVPLASDKQRSLSSRASKRQANTESIKCPYEE